MDLLTEILIFLEDKDRAKVDELPRWPSRPVRGALGKLLRDRLISKTLEEKQSFFSLSPKGQLNIDRQLAVLHRKNPLFGQHWSVIAFSVPEKERMKRDRLRRVLFNLGFQLIKNGLWISPYDRLEEVEEVLAENSLLDVVLALRVDRFGKTKKLFFDEAFDLNKINNLYGQFIDAANKILEKIQKQDVPRFESKKLIFFYAKILQGDPQLELNSLPPGWRGEEARQVYQRLRGLL